jgi:hypothetical protein
MGDYSVVGGAARLAYCDRRTYGLYRSLLSNLHGSPRVTQSFEPSELIAVALSGHGVRAHDPKAPSGSGTSAAS